MGIFDFLKNNNDKNIFNSKVKEIFNQLELDLNAENFKDYPVPYWYDIVKQRAELLVFR